MKQKTETENILSKSFSKIKPFLNEKQIRLLAAAEAMSLDYGGVSIVSRATGVSRRAITSGCKELKEATTEELSSVRRKGGGRKKTITRDPGIKEDLESLIDPVIRGDPESPLKWTAKSVRVLSNELNEKGHSTSHRQRGQVSTYDLLPQSQLF